VEACPTGALIFGDLNDPNSAIARVVASGKVEVLHPEYALEPKVQYIGLPKRFIAGEVVFKDKLDESAEGVTVILKGDGIEKTTVTDNYGDFEFEGLEADKEYTVIVERTGYATKKLKTTTKVDMYLGEIMLSKSVATVK
jgi:hypothetical protein